MPGEYLSLVLPEPTFERKSQPDLDIVFVHGLGGDRFGTWKRDDDSFWPQWLAREFPNCRVFVAGYLTSALTGVLSGAGASFQDVAQILADQLTSLEDASGRMLIVTHSLGGLIVKQMLRRCSESLNSDFTALGRSVKGVAFLGTPHAGAQLAGAVDIILRKFKSVQTQQLLYSGHELLDLNAFFKSYAHRTSLKVAVYYETEKTWGVHIVDRVTADPGVLSAEPIAVQANHVDICKPASRGDPLYHSVCKLIRQLLGTRSNTNGSGGLCQDLHGTTKEGFDLLDTDHSKLAAEVSNDYQLFTTPAADDRRDLKGKLTDANRAYLTRDAERKKERFAMALRRNLAIPAAITRYTRLMADVESRYQRHVQRAIAADMPQTEIDLVLQNHVVDPCVDAHSTLEHPITATLVDGAIYYLAGNCHLAFDHE